MNHSSEYKYLSEDKVQVICRRNNKETVRTVKVSVGSTYIIDQLNLLVKKDRGRRCQVIKVKGPNATVEFEGTKQCKRIPLDDLAEPTGGLL